MIRLLTINPNLNSKQKTRYFNCNQYRVSIFNRYVLPKLLDEDKGQYDEARIQKMENHIQHYTPYTVFDLSNTNLTNIKYAAKSNTTKSEKTQELKDSVDIGARNGGPLDESLTSSEIYNINYNIKTQEELSFNYKDLLFIAYKVISHKEYIIDRFGITSHGNVKTNNIISEVLFEGKYEDYLGDSLVLSSESIKTIEYVKDFINLFKTVDYSNLPELESILKESINDTNPTVKDTKIVKEFIIFNKICMVRHIKEKILSPTFLYSTDTFYDWFVETDIDRFEGGISSAIENEYGIVDYYDNKENEIYCYIKTEEGWNPRAEKLTDKSPSLNRFVRIQTKEDSIEIKNNFSINALLYYLIINKFEKDEDSLLKEIVNTTYKYSMRYFKEYQEYMNIVKQIPSLTDNLKNSNLDLNKIMKDYLDYFLIKKNISKNDIDMSISMETKSYILEIIQKTIDNYLANMISLLNLKENNLDINSTRLLTQGNLYDTLYNKLVNNMKYIPLDKEYSLIKILTSYDNIFWVPISSRELVSLTTTYKPKGNKPVISIPTYSENITKTNYAITEDYLLLIGNQTFLPEITSFYSIKLGSSNYIIDEDTLKNLANQGYNKEVETARFIGKDMKKVKLYG